MRNALLSFFVLYGTAFSVHAESRIDPFEDQYQYELFYEFTYQSNVIESFLLECTGARSVSYKFAFATAPISNSYKSEMLGLDGLVPDPFTGKSLKKRLLDEIGLMFSRDHTPNDADLDSAAEPVLMAQKDVLIMSEFSGEKDALCDFVFWEEVLEFEDATIKLLEDAKARKRTSVQHAAFNEATQEGLVILNRLFEANPLRGRD